MKANQLDQPLPVHWRLYGFYFDVLTGDIIDGVDVWVGKIDGKWRRYYLLGAEKRIVEFVHPSEI